MSEITLRGAVAYDPRGTVDVTPVPAAARVASVGGLRLGVLDNSKWNANRLLTATVAALGGEERFSSVRVWKKDSFSRDAPPELLDEIRAGSDIVLVAIGD
jgi:hypothetical protein